MPEPVTPSPSAKVAIPELIDQHGGQIYHLGLRFCGNAQDAEDLVQEVFLQAYRGWDGFEGRSSPKTWLYAIAARACQRMHRKRSGEPSQLESLESLLPFGQPRIAQVVSEHDAVFREQLRTEARERIEEAIASLPDDFRVPLILKEIVGFSVPEVASILGLEEGTVKSRVHRARLRLRAALDSVLPRQPQDAPPPAYSQQMCLDLLDAKQEALDRGVPFNSEIICDRCRSVFAALDLTQSVCRDLARGRLPPGLRERLRSISDPTGPAA
ncbi:MAG: RNA polymerase sigma factor [Planctomycetota bacterium]